MKVLVLEKERIVKKDIENQLKKHGLVLTELSSTDPDVVIVGQLSFLKELLIIKQQFPSSTKYIFLTNFYQELFAAELLQFTNFSFYQKPIEIEELIKIIKADNYNY